MLYMLYVNIDRSFPLANFEAESRHRGRESFLQTLPPRTSCRLIHHISFFITSFFFPSIFTCVFSLVQNWKRLYWHSYHCWTDRQLSLIGLEPSPARVITSLYYGPPWEKLAQARKGTFHFYWYHSFAYRGYYRLLSMQIRKRNLDALKESRVKSNHKTRQSIWTTCQPQSPVLSLSLQRLGTNWLSHPRKARAMPINKFHPNRNCRTRLPRHQRWRIPRRFHSSCIHPEHSQTMWRMRTPKGSGATCYHWMRTGMAHLCWGSATVARTMMGLPKPRGKRTKNPRAPSHQVAS